LQVGGILPTYVVLRRVFLGILRYSSGIRGLYMNTEGSEHA
jgi:hypothetical protein